jgi:CBS domain containing-hemolysin-like protein
VDLLLPACLSLVLLLLLMLVSALERALHALHGVDAGSHSTLPESLARQVRSMAANPFVSAHRLLLLSALLNLLLCVVVISLVHGPLAGGMLPAMPLMALLLGAGVLLGNVAPKLLAGLAPQRVLLVALRLLGPLARATDPLLGWAERLTDALLQRLPAVRFKSRLPMTREEFETLVETRRQAGQADWAALGMILEALELEQLMARDCMVPRVDLALLGRDDAPARAQRVLDQSAGRYAVVYGETPDAVIGVVDVNAWRLAGRPHWGQLLQSVGFVPETMPMTEVLEQHLLQSPLPVLLVDEYGGFEGLISMEELADWLLSDVAPWGREGGEVRELAPGRLLVDGGARVEDVERWLNSSLPNRGVDSIGGLVFTELGHVPKAGERLRLGEFDFKVRRVVKARILELEIRTKLQAAQPSADGSGEQ